MKKHFLYSHLSWPEIRDLDKENIVVIQPLAAIEDHGPHLPVETDNLLINEICRATAEKIPDDAVLMPIISYGYVEHHMDFPGPISIGAHNLIGYLSDALKSLARHGFKRYLLQTATVPTGLLWMWLLVSSWNNRRQLWQQLPLIH